MIPLDPFAPLRRQIGARLAAGFGVTAFVAVVVGTGALLYLNAVNHELGQAAERDRAIAAATRRLQVAAEQQSSAIRGHLLSGDTGRAETSRTAGGDAEALRQRAVPDDRYLEPYRAGRRQFAAALAELRSYAVQEEELALLDDIERLHRAFEEEAENEIRLVSEDFPRAAIFLWQTQGEASKERLVAAIERFVALRDQRTTAAVAEAERQSQLAVLFASGVVVLATMGGLAAGLSLTVGISRRLRALAGLAREIQAGNLDASAPVGGEDEVGQLGAAMQAMTRELRISRTELEQALDSAARRNQELAELYATLERSEERYRLVTEEATDIIFIQDLEGYFVYLNQRTRDLLGYEPEELVGRCYRDILTPGGQAAADAAVTIPPQDQTITGPFEVEVRRKDGSVCPFEVSLATLHQNKEPIAVMGIARDISERKRLEAALQVALERERRRADQLSAVNELAGRIGGMLRVNELLTSSVQAVREAFDYDLVSFLTLDTTSEPPDLIISAAAESPRLGPEDRRPIGERLRVGEQGITGWVAAHGQPLLVTDVRKDSRYLALPSDSPSACELALPVRLGERMLGVLDVQSMRPGGLDEVDLITLQPLAHQLAVALDNARLFDEMEARNRELLALNAVAGTVSSSLDLQRVLDDALAEVLSLLQLDGGMIFLVGPWGRIEFAAGRGLQEATTAEDWRSVGSNWVTLARQVMEDGQPVAVGSSPREAGAEPPAEDNLGERLRRATALSALVVLPMMTRGRALGALAVGSRTRHHFSEREIALLRSIAAQVAIGIENARLYGEAQRRLAEVVSLQAVGAALVREANPETVLRAVVEQAVKLTGATAASVELLSEDGRTLEVVMTHGENEGLLGMQLPIEQSLSGLAVTTGRAQWSHDGYADRRAFRAAIEAMHGHTVLVAPLKTTTRVIGTISVYNRTIDQFDDHDAELLTLLGNQAAMALENARLHHETRELAVLQERHRLARELHDDTAQALVAILRRLDLLQYDLDRPDKLRERIAQLERMTDSALHDVRQLSRSLHPVILEDLGLVPAIESLAADLQRHHEEIACSVRVEGSVQRLSAEAELAIFRVAQEALNNIVKHAQARHVDICLVFAEREVQLTVRDDGRGFAMPEDLSDLGRKGGMGVLGMRERAEALGGSFHCRSAPGEGTEISIAIPALRHETLFRYSAAPLG